MPNCLMLGVFLLPNIWISNLLQIQTENTPQSPKRVMIGISSK